MGVMVEDADIKEIQKSEARKALWQQDTLGKIPM